MVMIGMPQAMVRREVFDTIGSWDDSLVAEDFDFYLRVAAACCEFAYLDELIVNYRRYGGPRGRVARYGLQQRQNLSTPERH